MPDDTGLTDQPISARPADAPDAAAGRHPVDLLVIGGLTVDVLPGPTEATGGAARYAVEGAVAAGLTVALHTVAGDEAVTRAGLERLAGRSRVLVHPAPRTIRFEVRDETGERRLRLAARTEPMRIPDPDRLPHAAAVLFAPVAGEVTAGAVARVAAPFRAAGIQGWLRTTDAHGWVTARPVADVDRELAVSLRRLDLLIASHQDLGAADGPSALTALRAWAGPGPQLVVTAGAEGAWVDDGRGAATHVPARVVESVSTIGAGDAFAAVLVAHRGQGSPLLAAAAAAAGSTARYLATRPDPGAIAP